MPQLLPGPWFYVFLVSWITIIFISPKILSFISPNNFFSNSKKTSNRFWNWPWY
uniref:ATP synthase complex subunit 8 n=1 Tax=Hemisus marmoratus TaxID=83971 RepID=W0TJC2_9NEOB|nr:ATP synthase F0 subunit 8 [Hemisus marmoratus]BAO42901.1 ATPase subunit 8 [Hemisus marmoratus]